MKLTIVTVLAIALCLGSLAARSHALRALSAAKPEAVAENPHEHVALAAIDGHLRSKLHRLAAR